MLIQLTQGKVATIDDADYYLISGRSWHAQYHPSGKRWYAVASITVNGKHTKLSMHRVIMDAKHGDNVDHRDGDGLHNWRSNLRKATVGQNNQNRRTISSNSGFKGVHYEPKRAGQKKYCAAITLDRKKTTIGYFMTASEAAAAYNERASILFGDFAVLNEV